MSEDLEAVLRRVAAGELTPEQALQVLDGPASARPAAPAPGAPIAATDPSDPASAGPAATGPSPTDPAAAGPAAAGPSAATGPGRDPKSAWSSGSGRTTRSEVPEPPQEPVTTIRLKTSYRSVQLLADPTVAQIHVLGGHSIQHQGPALVITTAGPLDDDENERPDQRSEHSGRFSFSDLPKTIAWARSWREHQLTIRVNPALILDLDVTGADVKATGFAGGVRARLVASSLRGDKLHGPLDVEAISSSVKVTGVPTGDSRINCESSSVRLSLATGADLKIIATNRMGRLVLPELPPSTLPLDGETSETTIGDGRDRLTLEATMSSVTVNVQAWGGGPA
jgi:hypothetical protein